MPHQEGRWATQVQDTDALQGSRAGQGVVRPTACPLGGPCRASTSEREQILIQDPEAYPNNPFGAQSLAHGLTSTSLEASTTVNNAERSWSRSPRQTRPSITKPHDTYQTINNAERSRSRSPRQTRPSITKPHDTYQTTNKEVCCQFAVRKGARKRRVGLQVQGPSPSRWNSENSG